MKTLLHLVLLFGAMIGLMGQSTAMAMAPVTVAGAQMAAIADMGNCTEVAAPMQGGMPCKKITWQCIAAMGCGSPAISLPTVRTETALHIAPLPHARRVIAALLGRTVAPEIDPPAFPI